MTQSRLPIGFFNSLIDMAKKLVNPTQIILFGSYARGDFKDKSDIDLAFKFQQCQAQLQNWVKFKQWAVDDFATLRELDLINFAEVDESLQASIQREGVIIYERKN